MSKLVVCEKPSVWLYRTADTNMKNLINCPLTSILLTTRKLASVTATTMSLTVSTLSPLGSCTMVAKICPFVA